MKLELLILMVVSVSCSAFAQISFKYGMSSTYIQAAMTKAGSFEWILVALVNGFIVLGLMLYGASVVIWLRVLGRIDVSQAYPFVGLGFILTMLFGWAFLNERIGLDRLIGTLLVLSGVVLVARS